MTAQIARLPDLARTETDRAPINLRVPASARELIDRAAAIEGKSRTEFMLDSACRHARDVVLDQRLFVLDPDKYDALMRVLDNPPPPTQALKRLMRAPPPWRD